MWVPSDRRVDPYEVVLEHLVGEGTLLRPN